MQRDDLAYGMTINVYMTLGAFDLLRVFGKPNTRVASSAKLRLQMKPIARTNHVVWRASEESKAFGGGQAERFLGEYERPWLLRCGGCG